MTSYINANAHAPNYGNCDVITDNPCIFSNAFLSMTTTTTTTTATATTMTTATTTMTTATTSFCHDTFR